MPFIPQTLGPIDVKIILGQSNAEGGDSTGSNSPQYLADQFNTFIFYKPNTVNATNDGQIQTLKFGKNQVWRGTPGSLNASACEMSVGARYFELTGKPLMIIKYALGGSPLQPAPGGGTNATGVWQVNTTGVNFGAYPHYSIAKNNFILPALNRLKAMGYTPTVKWLYWCQGEADATDDRGLTYEAPFTELMSTLRADINTAGYLDPAFKFITMRTHNNFNDPGGRPRISNVRAAQTAAMTALNGHLMNMDGYPLASDLIHVTRLGQESIGVNLVNVMLGLPEPTLIF